MVTELKASTLFIINFTTGYNSQPVQIPIILLHKIHLQIFLSFPPTSQVARLFCIKITYEVLGLMFPCHISSQTKLPWFDTSCIKHKVLHHITLFIPSFLAYMNRNLDDWLKLFSRTMGIVLIYNCSSGTDIPMSTHIKTCWMDVILKVSSPHFA